MYVVTVEFTIDLAGWVNFIRLMLENAARTAFVIAHPGASRIFFHELQQPTDSPVKQEIRALLQAYRLHVRGLFKAGVKNGQLPAKLDQEAASKLFVSIVRGLVMQSMLPGNSAAMKA